MHKRHTLLYGIFISGVFLYLDRELKWLSLYHFRETILLGRWLGWHPFLNDGVAFGLPVPITLVSVLTVPLLGVLIWFLVTAYRRAAPEVHWQVAGLLAIIAGATSNLVDRLIYQHTVDYFLVFTAVINVADILIVLGFILLFWSVRGKPKAG